MLTQILRYVFDKKEVSLYKSNSKPAVECLGRLKVFDVAS